MSSHEYDIVAIGGGTAGLVTAAGAATIGAHAALIERHRLGGECLWTGCVPSKGLIGSARIANAFRGADEFGLGAADPEIDAARILASVREVRARVEPHDDPARFRAMGVDVIEGEARFISPREIEVDGRRILGRKYVIATGTRPAIPPIDGLEEVGYYTHETAFDRTGLPRSVVILGAGAIGIEFAQAYRRLGLEVTVVELFDRILIREDAELAERLTGILKGQGIRLLTAHRAVRAAAVDRATGGAGVALTVEGADGTRTVEADEIFVAAGRRPNLEALDLERAGVETGRQGVLVDDRLRTSQKHIFAAGDVTGGLLFTHVADHEARTVVRNALFPFPARIGYEAISWCTFTEPELAHVGLTESEARERHGDSVQSYMYDLSDLDRAIADRAAVGCVKLVTDRKGRLLGGHVLGAAASTMIVEVALAMKHGLRIANLASLVHPYPTMSEGVRKAADEYMRSRLTARARRWLDRYFRWSRKLRI
ncbi:MAG: dihydrolipoyl dehydrogenase family protein [Gemmatimonadota bacterium]